MKYLALACDYDGTISHGGAVNEKTVNALRKIPESGRKLILVTGRRLEELLTVCNCIDLFNLVVAENGAVLYSPSNKEIKLLAEKPSEAFIHSLSDKNVSPIEVGHTIVATWRPHEVAVLETIRELGLELQVIFNKDAVMVLPAGVNKASGLQAALDLLQLSPHNVIGVGDAENDHAFLAHCEIGVAVANAVPLLKERADFVTQWDHGDGVIEVIERLVKDDLIELPLKTARHEFLLGDGPAGEVNVNLERSSILIAGSSGGGKSTFATAFVAQLLLNKYQFCVIDPEGDYQDLQGATSFGSKTHPPAIEEALALLEQPGSNAVINLLGVPIIERPSFFLQLIARLQDLRSKTGHPHWLIIDEAHHVLPASTHQAALVLPEKLEQTVFITLHPKEIAIGATRGVRCVIGAGDAGPAALTEWAEISQTSALPLPKEALTPGNVLFWDIKSKQPPFILKIKQSSSQRKRHRRKYAEGDLSPERSFFFRGPEQKLNLRAQNLIVFLQLAEGVDSDTWLYHLRLGDYSRWFRTVIKDPGLAEFAMKVESDQKLTASESLVQIREAIEREYTLPSAAK